MSSKFRVIIIDFRRAEGGVLGLYFVALTCDQPFHFLPPSLPFLPFPCDVTKSLGTIPPTFNTGSSDCSSDFCLTISQFDFILFFGMPSQTISNLTQHSPLNIILISNLSLYLLLLNFTWVQWDCNKGI